MLDLTDSIAPKSDQMNAEDLLTGPRTFTIKQVRRGSGDDQPFDYHLDGFPRPFKPSKTVRRLLVAAWGKDAELHTGRRLTLYRDPDVRFGGQDVGGIRVSHMSHLDKKLTLALTVSKGKRSKYEVLPLADDAPASAPVPTYMADARAAKTLDDLRAVWQRAKEAGHLTGALEAEITKLGEALKGKTAPVEDEPPADHQGEPYLPDGES